MCLAPRLPRSRAVRALLRFGGHRAEAREPPPAAREPPPTTRKPARCPTFLHMLLYWPRSGMPHGYVCETPVHLVYRLKGCLPVGPLRLLNEELREQLATIKKQDATSSDHFHRVLEEYQRRYDDLLDAQDQTKYLLHDPRAARAVLDSWAWLEERRRCRRLAICVMGNHVHALIAGLEGVTSYQLGDLLGQHKRFTDDAIKKALGIDEKVWELGFFDRYVRPGQLERVLAYVLNNPVKAGLVRDWQDWGSTYVAEEYR